ncbi:MAG TPA: chromosome partitioning protein [Rectinemataceae bacterium]|nr:chromosome partitioning protein [Rectinemataceae bacterium]
MPMPDDIDLTGLDLPGAKAYLLDFATAAKLTRKELEAVEADQGVWTKRIALAEGKGMAELADQARARLAEIESKRAALAAELAETEAKVRRIREQLPMVAAKERSIDADRLLAELQLMTGTLLGEGNASLDAEMAKLESQASVDASLDALKRDRDSGG